MNVCVLGLWHLGAVTAACTAAAGHQVTGIDFDVEVIGALSAGRPPVAEPGLAGLIAAGLSSGRLSFSSEVRCAADADVLWVTWDTTVDDDDRADVDAVLERTGRLFPILRDGTLVLVSSQLPVGSIARLEEAFGRISERRVMFACSPENLRLGGAVAAFTCPDRVIAGTRSSAAREPLERLLRPFTDRIEWMSIESAEMTKHALNGFLATSIAFINEIAAVCEQVGADASDVSRGLKSDHRIGTKAYLSPGGAFAGGTLARDIVYLTGLGRQHGVATGMLSSVKSSNDAHRRWAQRRLEQLLPDVTGAMVGVWGLTYKTGTDTLRRSNAIELCRWLVEQGATVCAHDPVVTALPADLAGRMTLAVTPIAALDGASALVVATAWPLYRDVASGELAARMARCLVLDADRFTSATIGTDPRIQYITVGGGPS